MNLDSILWKKTFLDSIPLPKSRIQKQLRAKLLQGSNLWVSFRVVSRQKESRLLLRSKLLLSPSLNPDGTVWKTTYGRHRPLAANANTRLPISSAVVSCGCVFGLISSPPGRGEDGSRGSGFAGPCRARPLIEGKSTISVRARPRSENFSNRHRVRGPMVIGVGNRPKCTCIRRELEHWGGSE